VASPERRLSALLEASRTRILDDRHRELPFEPVIRNLVVSWLYGIINCPNQSIPLIGAICRAEGASVPREAPDFAMQKLHRRPVRWLAVAKGQSNIAGCRVFAARARHHYHHDHATCQR